MLSRRQFVKRGALWVSASSLLPRIVSATILPVTSASAGAGPSNNPGTTSAIDTAGATLLIATVGNFNSDPATADTVTDSKGNTWNHILGYDNAGGGTIWASIFYAWDHGGTPLSVGSGHTATLTGNYSSFCFSAWSGTQVSSNPFDQQNGNGGNAVSTLAVNSITPSVNNCLVITALTTNVSTVSSIDSSFSILISIPSNSGFWVGDATGYLVQGTAASSGPTWTVSGADSLAAAIASFKPASGAPSATRRRVIGQ